MILSHLMKYTCSEAESHTYIGTTLEKINRFLLNKYLDQNKQLFHTFASDCSHYKQYKKTQQTYYKAYSMADHCLYDGMLPNSTRTEGYPYDEFHAFTGLLMDLNIEYQLKRRPYIGNGTGKTKDGAPDYELDQYMLVKIVKYIFVVFNLLTNNFCSYCFYLII
jgi:hypothetical protein